MFSIRGILKLILVNIIAVIIFLQVFRGDRYSKKFTRLYTTEPDTSKALYEFLKDFNAFLIDIDVLKEIQQNNAKLIEIPNNVTFGISEDSVKKLNEYRKTLEKHLECIVSITNGNYLSMEIRNTHIFLKCKHSIFIQLSIFYKRNDYFWIGECGSKFKSRWFGDTQRLMSSQKGDFKEFHNNGVIILVPSNINKFLYDYNHSALRECNRELAELNFKLSNRSYKQNNAKNAKMLPGIHYLTSVLESKLKPYWVASGTLLGW